MGDFLLLLQGIVKTKLAVSPEGSDLGRRGHANTSAATFRGPVGDTLETVAVPDRFEGVDKVINHVLVVAGGGRDTKTLLADGDSGVVDALDVDAMLGKEFVRGQLRRGSVAQQDRHNVRGVGDNRNTELSQAGLDDAGVDLLHLALHVGHLEVFDGLHRARHNGRGQRRRKDEARRIGADHVHERSRGGNVAADDTVGLAEGACHNVDLVHDGTVAQGGVGRVQVKIEVLRDTSAARTVHTDGVDFVQEGDGAVLFGEVDNLANRADGAAHGVNGLKGNDLGRSRVNGLQKLLKMGHVVMAENLLLRVGMADALDHGGVVQRIREDDAARELAGEGGEGRVVRDIAGRKDERTFFVVQVRELRFEPEMEVGVASNVAGTTGTSAITIQRTSEAKKGKYRRMEDGR